VANIITPKIVFFLFLIPTTVVPVVAGEVTLQEAVQYGENVRARWPKEQPIDKTILFRQGARRLDSRHVTLYTDLAASQSVDELPTVFDLMVPQLCEYFELDPKNYESWKVEVFLIGETAKFDKSGALEQVPQLRNGYALRNRIWLREQPSEYYRRHLLLHEGVHAFMGYVFGKWGPPWYREGTAELLGTHCWKDKNLTLGYLPRNADEVPNWRRIPIVRNAFAKKEGRRTEDVFDLAPEDYDENAAYAWSWAFAAFCEHHPGYRMPFRHLARHLSRSDAKLSELFVNLLDEEDAKRFEDDWTDFVANIDFGYDFERTRIDDFSPGKPLAKNGDTVAVRADRGWQNSGLRLEKGQTYEFSAEGRFQLGRTPKIWWSEPNGITVRYHRGVPIGTLLATLRSDSGESTETGTGIGFATPQVVGTGGTWNVEHSGTLFFRINDFPSELDDNDGTATARIR